MSEIMFGYIYETTNLINNKKYIGKHKSNKFDKNYYGSGVSFKQDLEKYGKENFKTIILEEIDTNQEDLDKAEIRWIETANAVRSNKYYNNSYGGENEGWTGYNKAVKENHKLNGMYGKHHSLESRKKMSENLVSWNKGTTGLYSNEYKHKISSGISKTNKGMTWINNGIKEKHIPLNKLDLLSYYINIGWTKGRLKNNKVSEQNRGRKWMTNDKVNRFATKEQQEKLLKENFRYGYNSSLRKR